MDKEFGSFVVTDPNLVDEGIDVSGLKTKTDVSPFLLGNIADYPGIQYEAFNPTRLTDLMRLYSSGLPMIDTPTAAVPPATGGGADSGGGGQATLPGFDVDSPKNTEANQRLLDQGIQSAEDDKGDVMLEDFEMANLGGITGDLVEVEDLINYQFGDDAGCADPTGLDMSGTMGGAPVVFDINQTGDPTTTMLDVPTNTVGLAYTGEFDPNDEGTVFDTTSITPEDTEQSITQKVADFLGVDTSTINKAAIRSALNLVGGKALDTVIPIATVFDLVKDSFTKSPETSVDTFDTTPAKTSQGLTTSQFQAFKDTGAGEFDTTPIITEQEQIEAEYREANRIAQQREADQAFADQAAQKTTPTLDSPAMSLAEARAAMTQPVDIQLPDARAPIKLGDIDPYQESYVGDNSIFTTNIYESPRDREERAIEDIADIADRQPEIIEQKKNELADIYDRQVDRGERDADPTITSKTNKAKAAIGMPQMLGDVGGGDGGSDSPGGKSIVCTAMYQTTGLEDWKKAMKIWYIYQKKYLTIQHQEGYHKLFKPFVKGMYKNKIIKTIGAHIAKHRTQHLKHVMFNSKPSLLGKIYNKILEPICYIVGKYAKK